MFFRTSPKVRKNNPFFIPHIRSPEFSKRLPCNAHGNISAQSAFANVFASPTTRFRLSIVFLQYFNGNTFKPVVHYNIKYMRNILLSLFLLLVCAFKADCQSLDGWTLSTRSRDNYAGISLANGRIGIVTSNHLFGVKHILLNGVYDRQNGFSGVSNAVLLPTS